MSKHIGDVRYRLMAAAAMTAIALASPVRAQDAARQDMQIEAQPLADALRAIGRQTGRDIMFPSSIVKGKRVPRLSGRYTADDAIRAVLAGSDLDAEFKPDAVIIRGRSTPSAALSERSADEGDIQVTGSRIRSSSVPSPLISIQKTDMLAAGQASLADVVGSLPQNYGGGQNPGIGLNVAGSNNVSSASTINLRGIGADATLTLLNGHRLSYNSQRQSTDISAIPFIAVERMEIVADGASAIYGSDAVAGVANIILKRTFDGLATTARFGASTEGGNKQQQYSAIAGKSWSSGALVAAAEYEKDSPIYARQRPYTVSNAPGLWLFPALEHINATVTGRQELAQGVRFVIDALYNHRTSNQFYALDLRGNPSLAGGQVYSRSDSYAVAPSIEVDVGRRWNVSLSAMYGRDETDYTSLQFSNGATVFPTHLCHCNTAASVDVNAEGPIFALPAGELRVATGVGYRRNQFRDTSRNLGGTRETYFAYGEARAPLVAPAQGVALVHRFDLSGALSYEHYPDMGGIFTPKLGVLYAPSPDVEIKGSWGKSFKAPTLFQQFNSVSVGLWTASSRGGTGYPSTATAIQLTGGNPDLKPERAITWSATVVLHPQQIDGLRIETTYFSVSYRDRIAAPITFLTQALSNPNYRDLINVAPTDAQKAEAIASGNFSAQGLPYSPANVVAIIDNRSRNVTQQTINGVDLAALYRFRLEGAGELTLRANASYLHSTQRLSALQTQTQMAGLLFSPPHFRGRAGIVWTDGGLTASAFVDYVGGIDDPRGAQIIQVDGMTTADFTVRYATGDRPTKALARNLDISLSIKNAFNAQPPIIVNRMAYEQPYDATNYSPVGRMVSFGVSKAW